MGELPEAAGDFEPFLAELSTGFTGIEAERIDSTIEPHTSALLRTDAPWLHGRLLQGETIRIERLRLGSPISEHRRIPEVTSRNRYTATALVGPPPRA